MEVETLKHAIDQSLSLSPISLSIAFQGGEPTLWGDENYRQYFKLVDAYGNGHSKIYHAIQTNGLVISDQLMELIKSRHFLVGVSLDGSRSIHDKWRKDKEQNGTFSRVVHNIQRMKAANIAYNILCVVTNTVAENIQKVFFYYVSQGFSHLQFIPCMDPLGSAPGHQEYSLTSNLYGKFLIDLYDLWEEQLMKGHYISIRQFDNYIYMLQGQEPENCAMAGRCSPNFVIEANGDVFPCDFYVVDSHRLGNICSDSLAFLLEANQDFVMEQRHLTECKACPYYFICRGGCKRDCIPISPQESRNIYCQAYYQFFSQRLSRMRRLAHRSHF